MNARLAWIAVAIALIGGLLWLDSERGGPATAMSRCNLALTRADAPAADVLLIGSSRLGFAFDHLTMERMFDASALDDVSVDRIALARNRMRPSHALLENYLDNRGAPKMIALELSFEPTSGIRVDPTIYRRDVNLVDFSQLAAADAVARPELEPESALHRTRFALETVVTRAGALTYQAATEPLNGFDVSDCDRDDWTREPGFDPGFHFSWDDLGESGEPGERITALRAELAADASSRELADWQQGWPTDTTEIYDLDQPHRTGEMQLLDQTIAMAAERNIPVVLLPMPMYGAVPDADEMAWLDERYAGDARVFDTYAAAEVDLSTWWTDDAHISVGPAAELTTALLTQYILDDGALDGSSAIRSAP